MNEAIAREQFYHRTPNFIFHKSSQAKMFTLVDFSKGYYQTEPDEAITFLTTFNTPFGRFRFRKMP